MAIVGVGNCLGVHVFVSFSRIRGGGREKDAFSSLSELRPLSAQCCTQLPKRLRCGMHQQRVLVRPCASLLVPSGCRSGCRGGKQSLRSSNLDFFSRGKQVHRLSYRKKYLSITSSAAGNEGESADTVEKSESGSLSSVESEENVEGGEPEVVPAENFMFEDQLKIMEADIRVASGTLDGVKKVASSIIRVLSGASWIDNAAAAQKEKKIDLLPKPYRLLDGTDPSPAGPLRKKLADTWRRAESDFMAVSCSCQNFS